MDRLRIWQSATAVFLVMFVWFSILAFPTTTGPFPTWAKRATAALAIAFIVAGCLLWYRTRGQSRRAPMHAIAAVLIIIGAIELLFAVAAPQGMVIDAKTKFAMGVGGAALCGFAYGLTQFDTMRAAASIPVVALLVGVVVWPDARSFVESDVRQALITWMGVVLGVNGAAEAAKQVASVRSSGAAAGAESTSGDLPNPQA
ncbi:hypothetical protein GCM10022415_13030 [Knoellia locipacati]|uniref:Uncharacterized protein n=1 Tax=Knoellia locipacati TaxID=882824 RepID=A0A512SZC2_9MICO|nr:hypothetical protein [Knoellia locipacati]GEQ13253.1 hypothetical protein KLO01_13000 [Knoellia locipacati]